MTEMEARRNSKLGKIRDFTQSIADAGSDLRDLEPLIMQYSLYLRQTLQGTRPDFIQQRDIHDPSNLASGDALSPWHAAACLEDRTRTAAFIRGSIRAVEAMLEAREHRPLHLLEAGCGPVATLIAPLLSWFGPEELVVSLIDIHQDSIDNCLSLLDTLGVRNRVRHAVCGDITTVSVDSPVDICLSETMNSALASEPQVAITRALVRRYPNALLLPQSIRVNLEFIDWAAESSAFPMRAGDRSGAGLVFELNAHTAATLEEVDGALPAASLQVPDYEPHRHAFYTTRVEVYPGTSFSDYASQITMPVPLDVGDDGLRPGEKLRFSYRLGNSPGLRFVRVLPG